MTYISPFAVPYTCSGDGPIFTTRFFPLAVGKIQKKLETFSFNRRLAPAMMFPDLREQQTLVVKKTLDPIFDNESFAFGVPKDKVLLDGAVVHFTVLDHDVIGSNDLEGEAVLPLNMLDGVPRLVPLCVKKSLLFEDLKRVESCSCANNNLTRKWVEFTMKESNKKQALNRNFWKKQVKNSQGIL